MDENLFEIAEKMNLQRVADSVSEARKSLPVQPIDFDGLCINCGEDILPGRLALGKITCIECQTRIEAKARVGLK